MATVDQVIAQVEKAVAPESQVRPMQESLLILTNAQMRFPPQPDRMRSGHLNTWVREVGRLPASAFVKQMREKLPGNSIATWTEMRKRIKRAPGDILKASEKMLEKWKQAPITIAVTSEGLVGTVTNTASYSGWVQGTDQPAFHKATGWKDEQTLYDEYGARCAEKFAQNIIRNIEGG